MISTNRFLQGFCIVVLVLGIIREVCGGVSSYRARHRGALLEDSLLVAADSALPEGPYNNDSVVVAAAATTEAISEATAETTTETISESTSDPTTETTKESTSKSTSKAALADTIPHTFLANKRVAAIAQDNVSAALDATTYDASETRGHRIYSVSSFAKAFPDSNDVQLSSAQRLGIVPLDARSDLASCEQQVVYIAANPYYIVEPAKYSIPYLVPCAATLLQDIGQTFFDSLQVKHIPLHKLIVTSVLRTKEDIHRLQPRNGNATTNSCHQYATTFDISYNRYATVSPPGEERRAVRNDSLKWVLAEVLNDMRQDGRCYIKYERKQGCFHITVR